MGYAYSKLDSLCLLTIVYVHDSVPAKLLIENYVYSLTMNAGAGLFYEAAADLVYPMDEVVSASLLTLVFNAFGGIYTLLGSTISPSDMNWLLTGLLFMCIFD